MWEQPELTPELQAINAELFMAWMVQRLIAEQPRADHA